MANELETITIRINDDLFTVNKQAFEQMERNAYDVDPKTGEVFKDFVHITLWVEMSAIKVTPYNKD